MSCGLLCGTCGSSLQHGRTPMGSTRIKESANRRYTMQYTVQDAYRSAESMAWGITKPEGTWSR
jgi:hypothetical protein